MVTSKYERPVSVDPSIRLGTVIDLLLGVVMIGGDRNPPGGSSWTFNPASPGPCESPA
jgi:hypothetical protein